MPDQEKIVVPESLRFLLRAEPIRGRACGECTACCTALAVGDLDKPTYTRGEHLCEKGCAMYEQRPHQCRTWECMWLIGHVDGDERRRPDKLGLIFTWSDRADGRQILVAWEVWKDAAEKLPGVHLVNRIAGKHPMFIRKYGTAGTLLVGPKAIVSQMSVSGAVARVGM